MFSGFGSPSLKSVQRRLSKSISRAGEILTGVGPTPTKQFKNAIIDGEEDRAIDIYTVGDGDKPLYHELHPSKPFPSKKIQSSSDTPLHLSSRAGLMKLCVALLGKGGDPTVLNERMETCLHCICSQSSHPEVRAAVMEILLQWRGSSEAVEGEEPGQEEKLSLNRVDLDGNTAIHLAALNGLLGCVERLIALGAIISIVNKHNMTCCELADENHHSELALALELALIFQPVDASMAEFVASQRFPYDGHQGRLLLSGQSFSDDSADLDAFIEEALKEVAGVVSERDQQQSALEGGGKPSGTEEEQAVRPNVSAEYMARAEALLSSYAWNVSKLVKEYRADPKQVLSSARLQPFIKREISSEPATQSLTEKEKLSATKSPAVAVVIESLPVDSVVAANSESSETATEGLSVAKEEENNLEDDTADIQIDFSESPSSEPEAVPLCASVPEVVEGSGLGLEAGTLSAAADRTDPESTDSSSEAVPERKEVASDVAVEEKADVAAVAATSAVPPPPPPMEEEGCCFVCGEVMLPSLSVETFLAGNVEQPGSRRLECGSGHAFCVDCWSGSLTVQVKDNGLGCLPCLGFKCGEVLDQRWARVLLPSADLHAQFLQRRQRLVVDCCSALRACPIDNCGVVVRVAGMYEQSDAVKHSIPASALCSNGHLFCLECSQLAHSPCTCLQLPGWQTLIKDEIKSVDLKGKNGDESDVAGADLANALWVAANTKKCPRCQTPIEKDEGCNHMNCRKCRKEFCWICMQDWSLHSDNTGGYFQCNRFIANSKAGDAPEGSAVADLWAEEKGNAHAETLRLRERNKRMARFIHHYTRFQAHSDSVKLEGRMFKETARRIREGLLASVEGGTLKWLQGYQALHPLTAEVAVSAAEMMPVAQSGEKSGATGSSVVPVAVSSRKEHLFTDATAFLKDGFEELLKCRCILQWSYPYAFFEFENDDHGDYSRSTPQQRRNRFGRDHRSAFDLLQAELEAIVETLSDVVARRRLRAGRDQISLVTRAARSKRIELESVIVTFAINQQVQKRVSPNTSSRTPLKASSRAHRPEGYHRTRQMATAPSPSRPNSSSRNRPIGGLIRSESEDSMDLASLIYELEMATAAESSAAAAAQNGTSTQRSPPAPTGNGLDATLVLLERHRQLEALQLRMRLAFGTDVASTEDGSGGDQQSISVVGNSNADLPPPIPAATRKKKSTKTATAPTAASSTGTPNTRRLELRQARNSPAGNRLSYSIDPDFEMEDSDEDDEEEEEEEQEQGERYVGAVEESDNEVSSDAAEEEGAGATGAARPVRSARNARSASDLQSSEGAAAAHRADLERAAALRELLRFGSAGGIHGASRTDGDVVRGSSSSANRQQMRLARLTQRAEEEADLNRAILMSIQDNNQTADRRLAAAAPSAATVEGEEGEQASGTEGGSTAPKEEDVAMLVSMGFTQEQATQALVENRMNVEVAANRLLGIDF